MCGIVGYIGKRDAAPILMEGLHRLEYRGYDFAGIAVAHAGELRLAKCKGRVRELEKLLPHRFKGSPGIAHTRWATHGEPSDRNAHPHCDGANRIAVIHNGIIENAAALRARLESAGVAFRSETDSEVLAHLIAAMPERSLDAAVRAALRLVTGTYGLAVLDAARPEAIVVARNGSPVVLGIGEREMFVASDAAALVRHTRSVVYLDDGEVAMVRADGFETSTLDGGPTAKVPSTISWTSEAFDKGEYAHFMSKEIAEQPEAVGRTLSGRLEPRFQTTHLGGIELAAHELLDIRRVKILGCGSAYIAGCIGAHLIEQLARLPAHAEAGLRIPLPQPGHRARHALYRSQPVGRDLRHLGGGAGSQAQGRARARHRQRGRQHDRARMRPRHLPARRPRDRRRVDQDLHLHRRRLRAARRSISAASAICRPPMAAACFAALAALPEQIGSIIAREAEIARLAEQLVACEHAYFVGRSAGYAVAMEGALKLKEVSYLHAEAYSAAELKHGPLALITPETPTVVGDPARRPLRKNVSTIEEIRARRGPVFAVTHAGEMPAAVDAAFEVPASEPELDPILLNIPLQLLAYHVALKKGCDIDRPRNLAKSVTVE